MDSPDLVALAELEGVVGRASVERNGEAKPSLTIGGSRLRGAQRLIGGATIVVPILGAIAAVTEAIVRGVGAMELSLLAVGFFLTNLGLEFGWHRALAHRSFRAQPWLRNLFAVLGSFAGTGRIMFWVANHRRHHIYSDRVGDPHSPNVRRRGDQVEELGLWRGLWHAHFGHILTDDLSNCTLFARDVAVDPFLSFLNRHYTGLVLLGLAIPAAIGGAIKGTAMGAVDGLLWGGLFRMFLVYQCHWCLASFSHRFGRRPFNTGDRSGNSFIIAILSFGSGWQNNHHAFPSSAHLGLTWWQIDITAWFVSLFEALGWITHVRRPTPAAIRAKTFPPRTPEKVGS